MDSIPVRDWWPSLRALLGDRHHPDPVNGGNDPDKNPDGYVFGWGTAKARQRASCGRIFIIRDDSVMLCISIDRHMLSLRRSASGTWTLEELSSTPPGSAVWTRSIGGIGNVIRYLDDFTKGCISETE